MNNRYVDTEIHKKIVLKHFLLVQEFAQVQRLWIRVNYQLITPPPVNIR